MNYEKNNEEIKRRELTIDELVDHKGSVFKDPNIKRLFDSLSTEEQERYQKIGQSIDYDQVNNISVKKDDKIVTQYDDAIAHLVESLKSGIHPSVLTDDEKNLLISKYGREWYLYFNYTETDLYVQPTFKSRH